MVKETFKYSFTAADQTGKLTNGHIEAASSEAAVDQLIARSLIPIQISQTDKPILIWFRNEKYRRISAFSERELLDFTRQLASLCRSGLTVDRSLNIIYNSGRTDKISEMLLSSIRRGASLSSAFQSNPIYLPNYYLSILQAGEEGGAMANALSQIVSLLENSQATRGRISAALIYPLILIVTIVLSLILIVSFVLPQFDAIFAEAGHQLPLPTQLVMNLGQVLRQYGIIIISLTGASFPTIIWLLKKPKIRQRADKLLTKNRLYQSTLGKLEAARFARTWGMLTDGGLTLPRAFKLATATVSNTSLSSSLNATLASTSAGGQIAKDLESIAALPPFLTQMAQVGLETGQLSTSLIQAANILDNDAQRTVDRLLSIAVPLITVVMGILVAALIGSVLIGILSVNDLAG
jgi:general secretion pathway protein F